MRSAKLMHRMREMYKRFPLGALKQMHRGNNTIYSSTAARLEPFQNDLNSCKFNLIGIY